MTKTINNVKKILVKKKKSTKPKKSPKAKKIQKKKEPKRLHNLFGFYGS